MTAKFRALPHRIARYIYRRTPVRFRNTLVQLAFGHFGGLTRFFGISRPVSIELASNIQFGSPDERAVPMSSSACNASIAIVVHAYYLDVLKEILSGLKGATGDRSKIFVIITNSQQRTDVQSILRTYGFVSARIVIGQNVGRNFGPMLVELGSEILQFDYIAHFHTKKSLRTGTEQAEWRRHILDGLLGSGELLPRIVATMEQHSDIGLVGPPPYLEAPYWFSHWLSSKHRVRGVFAKMGLGAPPMRGYLSFPIGSMFVGRTSALRQLFATPWHYSDFDPEPAGDDGTVAHVIERGMGAIAEHNGYEVAQVAPNKQELRIPASSVNWTSYFAVSSYLLSVADVKVASFDFFDTLFTRPSIAPEDIQQYVGHLLKIRDGFDQGGDFLLKRVEAEAIARGGTREVTLPEIYDAFSKSFPWPQSIVEKAQSYENEIELRCLAPRTAVVDQLKRLKRSGTRIVVTSDTYLSENFIWSVLRRHDLQGYVDQIFVSSEKKARKDRGDIWPLVKQETVSPHGELLHIGDSEQSDIQQALRHSVRPIGIMHTATLAIERGLPAPPGWKEGASRWEDGVLLGPIASKLGNNPFRTSWDQGIVLGPEDFGFMVMGPLLASFTNWLLEVGRGRQKLLFVARDGYYLHRYYERARLRLQNGPALPEGKYLITSRRAAICASLGRNFDIDRLFGGRFAGSIRDFLLARVGIDDPEAPREPINSMEDVRAYICENEERFRAECRRQLALFSRYLAEQSVLPSTAAPIVDIGYSGTIQFHLQRALERPMTGLYMACSAGAAQVAEGGGDAFGYFGDSRTSDKLSPVQAYSMLLEAALEAPHSAASRYRQEIGGIGPEITSRAGSMADLTRSRIEAGITAYADILFDAYGPEVFAVNFSPEVAQAPFYRVALGHWRLSQDLVDLMAVEDDFFGNPNLDVLKTYGIDSTQLPI